MTAALGYVILAIGLSMIYIGFKGLSIVDFWGGLLSGKLPEKGSNA